MNGFLNFCEIIAATTGWFFFFLLLFIFLPVIVAVGIVLLPIFIVIGFFSSIVRSRDSQENLR